MFFVPHLVMAQEVEPKILKGKIEVPGIENLEGITIFNSTSNEGTISNKKGEFALAATVGDTLAFSAIQFKPLTIVVDKSIFKKGELDVTITVGINQLGEVFISSHDLSGDLEADVANIKVEKSSLPELSSGEIRDLHLNFPDDAQSTVTNSAVKKLKGGGVNILALLNATVNLVASVFPDKPEKKVYLDIENPKDKLRDKYADDFFTNYLKIKKKDINKYLYFIEDKGLNSKLLESGKELDLMEYLMAQAEEFKKEASKSN